MNVILIYVYQSFIITFKISKTTKYLITINLGNIFIITIKLK